MFRKSRGKTKKNSLAIIHLHDGFGIHPPTNDVRRVDVSRRKVQSVVDLGFRNTNDLALVHLDNGVRGNKTHSNRRLVEGWGVNSDFENFHPLSWLPGSTFQVEWPSNDPSGLEVVGFFAGILVRKQIIELLGGVRMRLGLRMKKARIKTSECTREARNYQGK